MLSFTSPRPLQLFVIGIAILLAFGVSTVERDFHSTISGPTSPKNTASLDPEVRAAGANESWWQTVSAQIARSEYEPKATDAGLQAPNRAHNLRTTFSAHGIEVVPRTTKEVAPTWSFQWQTSSIGREGLMQNVAAVSPKSAGVRVTYQHDGWSEWYVNTAAGLEQGFTIERRPAGNGPLQIAGRVPEALTPQLREEGAIDFIESHGACAIRYGELHVWDADDVQLHSEVVVRGHELAIVIDDQDAEYPLTIDPLMTSPAWTAESNQDSANFGVSVATAGDVNGDGFSDVIVGAQQYDNPTIAEGKAFLYYGSASGLSLTPNWTCEGNQLGAQLGISVATAGDVNGDGFDDVIVGAFVHDSGESDEGKAFVFHGSANGPSAVANWSAEGNQASACFGISVATAGDVNDDGFSDVIVGAYFFDNGQTDEGRAFVYYGAASGLSPTANWIGESDNSGARFGASVATAGDVNGDGFDDVIVGANLYVSNDGAEGRAYVYHGSASGLSPIPSWVRESNNANSQFGNSVATAGDVNGDGYSDVIVGAHHITNGEGSEGRAYAYYGSSSGLSLFANWTAESNQPGAVFGYSVAPAGDVNGDGYADVIIGSYLYDNGETDEGGAFVHFGSASGLSANPDWEIDCDQVNAEFGVSVATAGDVNGDGFSDVIIGAALFDNGQTDEGGAFVYHGSGAGLPNAPAWTGEGGQTSSLYGHSIATAGDVNGDGFSDVIVGAEGYDNGQTNEGRAFVYHGSATGLANSPAWTAESDQANAHFGLSVGMAGDVNGDGFSDVIVGAPYWDSSQTDKGAAFVYYGSAAGLATSAAWTAESEQAGASYGGAVATAGDVNGDGFSDVIVGADQYDNGQFLEGRAFVYNGSPIGLGLSPDWTAESNQANARFGRSVATAGDVNGDGFSDVIVGAPYWDSGQTDEGAAFVYYGSALGLATSAWIGHSFQNGTRFGNSVGTAGDVNGDGFSDVIVGAHHYVFFGYEGRAFVFHGSALGLNGIAAWTADGDQTDAEFGFSVGTAGDVNGDGFSDVIVGADTYNNGQANEGRAFVFHGSALGLATSAAWTAESDQTDAYFGYSVATAGDVNGDGFSDVIVGADHYTNGQFGEGGVFVYYGNGGDCLDRNARQARTDDAAPISLLGRSDSPSAFRLKTLGRTPAGRGNVRLQAEIKPLGVPFNGSGLVNGSVSNTGTPSGGGSAVALAELASGLNANTLYHWRLRIASDSPFFPWSPWFSQVGNAPSEADLRTAAGAVAIVDPSVSATHLSLEPNAPNPFTDETRVAYSLPERGRVRLAVYDVAGREVAVLANGVQDAGHHNQSWDGRASHGARLTAGVYFARLEFGGRVEARKMVLTR
jgi:hypothetical protein